MLMREIVGLAMNNVANFLVPKFILVGMIWFMTLIITVYISWPWNLIPMFLNMLATIAFMIILFYAKEDDNDTTE